VEFEANLKKKYSDRVNASKIAIVSIVHIDYYIIGEDIQ
jgi:hypothetical protein